MAITINTSPNTISSSKNPIPLRVNADSGWAANDSYKIRILVEVETVYGSGTYLSVYDKSQTPDLGSLVTWDLRYLLDSFVEHDRPNEFSLTQPFVCQNSVRKYRYTLEEVIDGAVTDTISPVVKSVVRGGFDWMEGQYMKDWTTSKKFLTHQPREKLVSDCQPEWVKFVVQDASATALQIRVVATRDDDTTAIPSSLPAVVTVDQWDAVIFGTGFNQLGLGNISGNVISWQIWIENQSNTIISEVQTYVLNRTSYNPNSRVYIFENVLGGYDTLYTTGKMAVKRDVVRESAARIISPVRTLNTELKRPILNYSSKSQHAYIQQSGWLDSTHLQWAEEILDSEDVVLIRDYLPNPKALGSWRPVNITSRSEEVHKDNEFLRGLKFSMEDAFYNRGI